MSLPVKHVTLPTLLKPLKAKDRTSPRIVASLTSRTTAMPAGSTVDGGMIVHLYSDPSDANSSDSVSYHGGPRVQTVALELVFWGPAWNQVATTPSMAQITDAVSQILAGPYLYELKQYGYQSAAIHGTTVVASAPPSPYTYEDIANMIWNLIDQGEFPEPDDPGGNIFFMVFMGRGTTGPAGEGGAHGGASDYDFPWDVDEGWVGYVQAGGIDFVTEVFSHELVEGITDPHPKDGEISWTMERTLNGGNEIGDACRHSSDRLNGITVQAYWSERQKSCVIPWGGVAIVTAPGALLEESGNVTAPVRFFVAGSDGHVWENYWSPSAGRWEWTDHGTPPGDVQVVTGPSALLWDSSNTSAPVRFFVAGSDGHVWENYWSPSAGRWEWTDHGLPPGGAHIVTAPGALLEESGNATAPVRFFVAGSDGHVWENYWSPSAGRWEWADHGTPPGDVQVVTGPSALLWDSSNTSAPVRFFVAGSDGHVWENYWSPSAGRWEWADHGTPS